MKDVWFVFRLYEMALSILCMIFHVVGFLYKEEPMNHDMYFCGTFFGFTVISLFANIGLCVGAPTPLFLEALIACIACFFFLLCSIMSMHYAEIDFHLMYLSDYEESIHPFFQHSKYQSVAALVCSIGYLLHAVFAIDALIGPGTGSKIEELEAQPIKLYLFCRPWFAKCHSACCDNLRCCRAWMRVFEEDQV